MTDKELLRCIVKEVRDWDRFRVPSSDRDALWKICNILRDEGLL